MHTTVSFYMSLSNDVFASPQLSALPLNFQPLAQYHNQLIHLGCLQPPASGTEPLLHCCRAAEAPCKREDGDMSLPWGQHGGPCSAVASHLLVTTSGSPVCPKTSPQPSVGCKKQGRGQTRGAGGGSAPVHSPVR